MKNYSLNNLTDYDNHILSDHELKHYSQPIIAIAEQKRLPIKVPTACDNTTLIRIDIEPHNLYTDIEKLQREFSSLLTRYPKSFFKINGEKLSFYRPKENRTILSFKKLLDSEEYDDFIKENPNSLPICYGETVENNIVIGDLKEQTHLLIGGTSGSGKSVLLHSIINSLMYHLTTDFLQFALFDFKGTEFSCYEDSPYLKYPICYDPKDSEAVLDYLIAEMESRYKSLRETRTFDIDTFNSKFPKNLMPFIVVVVDEFADMILRNKKGIEDKVQAIAQKARACGIHLIISTQNPIVEVCTTLIKANLPTRIALFVPSHDNSQVIIEESGAQNLLKKGDMLLKDGETIRLQGAYLSKTEILNIQDELIKRFGKKDFSDNFITENTNTNADGKTVIKKRLVKEGDKVNDKIVLDNIAYDIATFCFDKGRASRAVVRQFLGTGDGPAIRRINKLMHYKIIGDYNQEQKRHPFLITEEQFYSTFIALREVNNA